jgi:hypothetical protein
MHLGTAFALISRLTHNRVSRNTLSIQEGHDLGSECSNHVTLTDVWQARLEGPWHLDSATRL